MLAISKFLVVVILGLSATPTQALAWTLGSNLGFGFIQSSNRGDGSSTVLAWPSSLLTYQPALRLGLGGQRGSHEVTLDSGLFYLDQAGSALSMIGLLMSYQYTLAPSGRNSPFGNVGVGFYREGGAARASASTAAGVGLGMRHAVGNGHGALRSEIRLDHLEGDDTFGRPPLTTFGLRLGFDLWL